jgi:hypothetical protein
MQRMSNISGGIFALLFLSFMVIGPILTVVALRWLDGKKPSRYPLHFDDGGNLPVPHPETLAPESRPWVEDIDYEHLTEDSRQAAARRARLRRESFTVSDDGTIIL